MIKFSNKFIYIYCVLLYVPGVTVMDFWRIFIQHSSFIVLLYKPASLGFLFAPETEQTKRTLCLLGHWKDLNFSERLTQLQYRNWPLGYCVAATYWLGCRMHYAFHSGLACDLSVLVWGKGKKLGRKKMMQHVFFLQLMMCSWYANK